MSIDGTVTAGSCRTEEEKTLRIIAGAPWYVSNLQLHEDLEVPYLVEHIRRLQVLQYKCLDIIMVAPWYVSNLQLHEDLDVPYIGEHMRNLAKSFDIRISGAENLLVRQLGKYLFYLRDEESLIKIRAI